MANLFERGTAWLAGKLEQHAGSEVVYSRSDHDPEVPSLVEVTLTATVGRSELTVSDGNGVTNLVETRDYTVDARKLLLGGAVTLPQPGDVITEVRNSQTLVCKVLDLPGRNCYELDPTRTILRIHTKIVSVT